MPVEKLVVKEVPKIVEVEKMVFPIVAFRFDSAELTELGKEIDGLVALEGMKAANEARGRDLETPANPMQHGTGRKGDAPATRKSIGALFVEAKGHVKSGSEGPVVNLPDYDTKTLFERGAGFEPESTRSGRVEEAAAEANDAVTGMVDKTVDVHDAMIALQRAEMTLQLTVQIRNKLVGAYNDIMRMPI